MAKSANNLNAVLQDTANAIRGKTEGTDPICPRDFADEIASIQVGIIPTGTKNITSNGTNIDVYNYANVNVNVPNPSTGQLPIYANGIYNVVDYATVSVAVSATVEMAYPSSSQFAVLENLKTAKTEIGQMFQWLQVSSDFQDGWDYHFGVVFSNYDGTKEFKMFVEGQSSGTVKVEFQDANGFLLYQFTMPKGYTFKIPYFWNGGDSCKIVSFSNGIWYDGGNRYARITSAY